MPSLIPTVKQWLGLLDSPAEAAAERLYPALVAQARQPRWYEEAGVPDTFDGRFEMVLVHLFLVQTRLAAIPGPVSHAMQRRLSELFFRDMDRTLRELGVSDTGVGRRIKAMAEAYYGRSAAYRAAVAEADQFAEALARNVYGKEPVSPAQLRLLRDELLAWREVLQRQADAELLAGSLKGGA